jgi:hypothetical protein
MSAVQQYATGKSPISVNFISIPGMKSTVASLTMSSIPFSSLPQAFLLGIALDWRLEFA